MTTSSQSPSTQQSARTYPNPIHQVTVDGGYSGNLTVTVAAGNPGVPPMVFLDSDLIQCGLVLTPAEADELAAALGASTAEVLPPQPWDIAAFASTFGYPPPAEHVRTSADLTRHVRAVSDQREAERA